MAKNNSLYNFTILRNSFATGDHKVQIWTKENKTKQFFINYWGYTMSVLNSEN